MDLTLFGNYESKQTLCIDQYILESLPEGQYNRVNMVKPTINSSSESQDLPRVPGHCQPKIRNAILKSCENDLIHIICNCVYNVIKGNILGLRQEKVNKLACHKARKSK